MTDDQMKRIEEGFGLLHQTLHLCAELLTKIHIAQLETMQRDEQRRRASKS